MALSAVRRGVCFGYDVRSALPFRFLRDGRSDGDVLEVDEAETAGQADGDLVFDWPASADQPHTQLFQDNGTYWYSVEGGGSFLIDPDRQRVTVPAGEEAVRREQRLWSLPTVLCFAARGDVPVHGAAVEVGDSAIVIAAPRTFGKTTLAAAFHAHGYRVLSEDITCVRLSPSPHVVPGPAMLRLRTDVADGVEVADAYAVGRDEARLHLALPARARGSGTPVPLRAILLLRDGTARPRLVRVAAADALPDLWELTFRLTGAAAFAASFEGLADLARSVSIWDLFRPMGLDALADTVDVLANGV